MQDKDILLAESVLRELGYSLNENQISTCFSSRFIGKYNHDGSVVCIMLQDNLSATDFENFKYFSIQDSCIIEQETIKEIAYKVKTLITDYGLAIHPWTLKTRKPYRDLEIINNLQDVKEKLGAKKISFDLKNF